MPKRAGSDRASPFAEAHRLLDAFWRTPIASEYAHYFGAAPAVWLNFTTFRRDRAGETATYAPWHFDYNFFSRYDQALVVWVPLDKVGTDAPGLEFRLVSAQKAPTRQGTASDGLFSIATPDGQYLVLRYAELYGRS